MNLEQIADLANVSNVIDRLELLWAAVTNRERGTHRKRNKWRGMRTIRVQRQEGMSAQDIEDHLRQRGVKIHGRRITSKEIIFSVGTQYGSWPDWLIKRYVGGNAHTNTWASRRRR